MTTRYTTYLRGTAHIGPLHVIAPEPPRHASSRDNPARSVCGEPLPNTREAPGGRDLLYLHLSVPSGMTPCGRCTA